MTDILLGGNPKFLARAMMEEKEKSEETQEAYEEAFRKALSIVQKEKEKVTNWEAYTFLEPSDIRQDESITS